MLITHKRHGERRYLVVEKITQVTHYPRTHRDQQPKSQIINPYLSKGHPYQIEAQNKQCGTCSVLVNQLLYIVTEVIHEGITPCRDGREALKRNLAQGLIRVLTLLHPKQDTENGHDERKSKKVE